jgi:CheY-like chemotaxis protein
MAVVGMKSVLVVEDELAIAELVEIALSYHGFAVEVAHDGNDALHRLAHHKPDLVLSDVMMPLVGGVELARRIHASPELAAVPVILMSAAHEPPRVAGDSYRGFLRKPFDVETLVDAIERVIGPPP